MLFSYSLKRDGGLLDNLAVLLALMYKLYTSVIFNFFCICAFYMFIFYVNIVISSLSVTINLNSYDTVTRPARYCFKKQYLAGPAVVDT